MTMLLFFFIYHQLYLGFVMMLIYISTPRHSHVGSRPTCHFEIDTKMSYQFFNAHN
ncbi:hypothetical protein DEO72_LG1g2509 [Vigna unguiculata]|uniref:Uncharacterized protein n=1 Tax=Vigna unguiculata TaxID=3917 RepID=A0A4D6KQS4_VIGUN|nr:hypothetical protein DEO72_LG1g2509 [Vigna unguiculata]